MNPRISTHQATPDKQEMIRRRGGVAELSAPHREELEIDKETTDSVVSAADESRSVEESRADAFKRRLSRLALDVHDGPMQNLTVIGLSLNDLKRRMHLVVPDEHQSNINESVAQITDELVQVEQELRSLISALESGSTQSIPLLDAIESEIREFKKLSSANVQLSYDGNARAETDSQRIALQSIARAALTNAAKHGDPENVEIRLSGDADDGLAADQGRRPRLHPRGGGAAGALRALRHARARRDARRRAPGREPAGRPHHRHRDAAELASTRRLTRQPPSAAAAPDADGRGPGWTEIVVTPWAVAAAIALAAGCFVRYGLGVEAVAWAVAQAVLVGLAAYDLAPRRLPNAVTVPTAALAVLLRLVFERSVLGEVLVAGVAAFAAFLLLALLLRGGVGMGDVKLAGMLGFLLGGAVLAALVIGAVAGGVAAVVVLARPGSDRRTAFAYGPYLALGGAIAILGFNPPPLV